ncbi:conserved alanine and arginine rich domain protein [Mycobacterium kansasii 732]|nr:conserved alanine and arginine rich domain protein [Mycobacterium kansasii 732]
MAIAHHRTGRPHGWIHNELRRRARRRRLPRPPREQLKARIEALRQLTSEQS